MNRAKRDVWTHIRFPAIPTLLQRALADCIVHFTVNPRPALLAFLATLPVSAAEPSYRELLLADKPAAYWRFDTIEECCTSSETDAALRANAGDKVSLLEAGPRPPEFPAFSEENTAADFTGYERDTVLRVKDPG